MSETVLLDKKALREKHPALNNKWTLEWLIRTRQIPIVKIGRRVFFDPEDISAWIKDHKVPAVGTTEE